MTRTVDGVDPSEMAALEAAVLVVGPPLGPRCADFGWWRRHVIATQALVGSAQPRTEGGRKRPSMDGCATNFVSMSNE